MTIARQETETLGLFGLRAQRSRAALEQIAGAPASLQADLVRVALDLPSHRGPVLDLLASGALEGMEPAALDAALGHPDRWPQGQRRVVCGWFLGRDAALFERWAKRSALHPQREERSGDAALARRRLAARLLRRDLPHSLHCDFATRLGALAELSALQRFADHRLARPSGADWERLRSLVASAVDAGAVCTLAGLFRDGILDAHAQRDEVQEAFHLLDWSRFGSVKAGFARRTPLPEAPGGRFAGVQLWAQGRPSDALDLLLRLAEAQPSEGTIREAVLAAAAAGRPESRLADLVRHVGGQPGAQLGWLLRLGGPKARLGERDLEALARLELPAASDPLLGALAAAIVRALPLVQRPSAAWQELQRRLSERSRRWRRLLPPADREWLGLLRDLRRPGLGQAELTVLLRRALLLEPTHSWMAHLFAALHREDRLHRLTGPDGAATDLGMLVRTLCIRAVDRLSDLTLDTAREEQALLSSDPLVVLGAVAAALDRSAVPGRTR